MIGRSDQFQTMLMDYYAAHGRHDLPWRLSEPGGGFDPYKILVSELMLQQTQVKRVIPKYDEFLKRFPDAKTLAAASLGDVLIAWQGLGYNRRAKYLWQTAQMIAYEHSGQFPDTLEGLVVLPGVGKNTAGAILAYAFNQPAIFIETNIRTVYIHHFFNDHTEPVSDKAILLLLEQTLDRTEPRTFYWALMDYGTYLKQTVGTYGSRSKSYVKQSPFHGSKRQVRGKVLRTLAAGAVASTALPTRLNDPRSQVVLDELMAEGLITLTDGYYQLA